MPISVIQRTRPSSPAKAGDPVRRGRSINHQRLWNTGSPRASRAMTCESTARSCLSNTPPHSRGAMRPRFGRTFVPRKTEGAGKAGCPMHPQPRVRNLSEAHERSHRGFAGTPGLPCAMVLTVSFVLSPVIGLVCHRRLRIGGEFGPVGPALVSANLTPASGRQDHTTSPSATCVVRLRAGGPLTSPTRTRPATPFARRRCRVHRIPPRVRDDREPPLWGRDGQAYRVDFSSGGSGIFFETGLDRIC